MAERQNWWATLHKSLHVPVDSGHGPVSGRTTVARCRGEGRQGFRLMLVTGDGGGPLVSCSEACVGNRVVRIREGGGLRQ